MLPMSTIGCCFRCCSFLSKESVVGTPEEPLLLLKPFKFYVSGAIEERQNRLYHASRFVSSRNII